MLTIKGKSDTCLLDMVQEVAVLVGMQVTLDESVTRGIMDMLDNPPPSWTITESTEEEELLFLEILYLK